VSIPTVTKDEIRFEIRVTDWGEEPIYAKAPHSSKLKKRGKFCDRDHPMSIQVEFQATAPPLRWDKAGGIRIGESRVTLDSLLAAYNTGSTPEEIALQYDVLHLSEIYATITYYLTHRQQIDNYLEQRRQNAQHYRQELAQNYNLVNLRQRLLARHPSQVS
jgi:uncharacterized protein (DUF433 family)